MQNKKNDILENLDIFSLDDLEQTTYENNSLKEDVFFEVSNNKKETISISNLEIENSADSESIQKEVEEEKIFEELEKNLIIEEQKTENIEKTNKKEKSKILENIIFLFKYISTSTLIFFLLLLTTNYNAYVNIAKSYLYKEEMQKTETSIISSVEAAKITTQVKDQKEIRKQTNQEDQSSQKSKYSIKNLVSQVDKSSVDLDIEITPYENRVIIPKIWKNIPLLDIQNQEISWAKELENIFMKELENGVIRYPGSTKPWKDWNTFVFWHSSNFPWIKWDYNDVFALLDNVVYGDEVIMYYNQKKYTYKIKEKKVITPWDVEILKREENKDELTLMTCRPIWTTLNRLIVIWEVVEEEDIKEEILDKKEVVKAENQNEI